MTTESLSPAAVAYEAKCRPDWLLWSVVHMLRAGEPGVPGRPIEDEDIDLGKAYLAASSLMMAFGITPAVDPDDHSREAEMIRGLLLESATRTTTRHRRAL